MRTVTKPKSCAHAAVAAEWEFADRPVQTTPFLLDHLRPIQPADAKAVNKICRRSQCGRIHQARSRLPGDPTARGVGNPPIA